MKKYVRPEEAELKQRLAEPVRFINILAGPRQVGKTTIIRNLIPLTSHHGYYISVDGAIEVSALPGNGTGNVISGSVISPPQKKDADWLRYYWREARNRANKWAETRLRNDPSAQNKPYVFAIDEIQKIEQWSEIVKGLWDEDRANEQNMHVVLLGSAPLLMQKARQFGLEGMLHNPQTLGMLIAAVQGNTWPNTKLETYELACHKMAEEHSDEHRVSQSIQSPLIEQLLDAAGFLCATLLLANASEFSENDGVNEEQVGLNKIIIPDGLPCEQVLKSRLFNCTDGQLYAPVHRSVAEFLGARFLAKKINEGLPFGRILALMRGFDNGVVAALRGLMSWLGVHSPDVRDKVIKIDPSGMVLYGDVQLFSIETKQQLLFALRYEARSNTDFHCNYGSGHLFSALITRDMTGQLLDFLISPSREQYDQKILNCILKDLIYRKILKYSQ